MGNQAAWKCDDCRKSGLERKRRCGWLPAAEGPETVVWGRKNVALTTCPRSTIREESLAWLEEFQVWKLFGGDVALNWPARTAEAFTILEGEWRKESGDGQR